MNMKQSCKALICAIEGELDGRHCTEEQAAAILDHALPSLTEALARVEAELEAKTGAHRILENGFHGLKGDLKAVQAQLADVLYILDQHRAWTGMGWEQLPVPVHAVEKIRSKLAQAEQQEAQGAQAGLELIGYANFDRLDNMLDDRTATVFPDRSSYAGTPVYRARAALATQPAVPAEVERLSSENAELKASVELLEATVQDERQLRAKVGRIAHYLNEFASGRSTFSRIQEINDAIQGVSNGN